MASSGSNKFMQEIYDQFLACKICYETYMQPKTLSCLHTFCCHCLEKHVDSERERSSYRYMVYSRAVSCPICRKKTELPSGGVRRLPDNFLVGNLSDMVSRRKPTKAPFCEICFSSRNTCLEACVKCLDCTKLLCKECVELHRKTKVTSGHSLCDIDVEKDIECKIHKEEPVRFYCEPCEVCICVVCTFQEHKGHDVSSFKEGISKYRVSMEQLLGTCKTRVGELSKQLDLINNCEKSMKLTEAQIRDMSASLTTAIRGKERQLLEDLRGFYGADTEEFLGKKDNLQDTYDNLKTTSNLTEIILRDKGVELLLLRRDIEEKVKTLMSPELETPPEKIMAPVRFIPGSIKFGILNTEVGHSDEQESDMETSSGVEEEHQSSDDEERDEVAPVSVSDMCTQTEIINTKELAKLLAVQFVDTKCQTEKVDMMDVGINARTVISVGRCVNTISPDFRERETMTDRKQNQEKRIQTDRTMVFSTGVMTDKAHLATVASNTQPTATADVSVFTEPVNTENKKTLTNKIHMVTRDTNTTLDLLSETPKIMVNCSTETHIDTADKAMCTEEVVTKDAISGTIAVKMSDAMTDRPIFQCYNKGTSTIRTFLSSKGIQVSPEPPQLLTVGTSMPRPLVNNVDTATVEIELVETGTDKPKFPSNDRGTTTPVLKRKEQGVTTDTPVKPLMVDKATEKPALLSLHKGTSTLQMDTSEKSIETDKASFVDTCTDKPNFPSLDACTSTQSVILKDSHTETDQLIMVTKSTDNPNFLTMEKGTGVVGLSHRNQQTETVGIQVDTKLLIENEQEIPMFVCDTDKSSAHKAKTTDAATDPICFDITDQYLEHKVICFNCRNILGKPNDIDRGQNGVDRGCDPIIMDYLDAQIAAKEAELRSIVNAINGVSLKLQEAGTGTSPVATVESGVGDGNVRLVNRGCSPVPVPMSDQATNTFCNKTKEKNVGTEEVSLANVGTSVNIVMVSKGMCTDKEPVVPPVKTHEVGVSATCFMVDKKSGRQIKTSEMGTVTHVVGKDKGTLTIKPEMVERGSAAFKILTHDKDISTEPVVMRDKQIGTTTVKTKESTTCMGSVLRTECGTSTPKIYTTEKETSTVRVLTMNKNVATANTVSTDKATETKSPVYIDAYTLTRPVRIYDKGKLPPIKTDSKETMTSVLTSEMGTETTPVKVATKSTMAIRGIIRKDKFDKGTSTALDAAPDSKNTAVDTTGASQTPVKNTTREVYFPAHLKKTSIFLENVLDDPEGYYGYNDACVGTEELMESKKLMIECATNTDNGFPSLHIQRSKSETDAEKIDQNSLATERLWTSAMALDRDSGTTAFVPRSKHREMTVVCKVEEATMTPEIVTQERGTMTDVAVENKAVGTDLVSTDGRINECISKLRHVTQRLEAGGVSSSPTQGGAPVTTMTQKSNQLSPAVSDQSVKSNQPLLSATQAQQPNLTVNTTQTDLPTNSNPMPMKPVPPPKPLKEVKIPKSLKPTETSKPLSAMPKSASMTMPRPIPPPRNLPPTMQPRLKTMQTNLKGSSPSNVEEKAKSQPCAAQNLPKTATQTGLHPTPTGKIQISQQPIQNVDTMDENQGNSKKVKQANEGEEKKKEKHRRKRLDIKQLLASTSSRESLADVTTVSKTSPKAVQPAQYHKITKFFKQFKPKKDKSASGKAEVKQDEEALTPVAKRRLLSDLGQQKEEEKENKDENEQTCATGANKSVEDWFQETPGSVRRHLMHLKEENADLSEVTSSAVEPSNDSPLVRRRLLPMTELVRGPEVTAKIEQGQTLTPVLKHRTNIGTRGPLDPIPPDFPAPRRKLIKPYPRDRKIILSDSSDSSSGERTSSAPRHRRKGVLEGIKKEQKKTMTPKLRRKLLPDLTKKQLLKPKPYMVATPLHSNDLRLSSEDEYMREDRSRLPPADETNSDIVDSASSSFHSCHSGSDITSHSNGSSGGAQTHHQQDPEHFSHDFSPKLIILEPPPAHLITGTLEMSAPNQVLRQAPPSHHALFRPTAEHKAFRRQPPRNPRDAFFGYNPECDDTPEGSNQEVFV